MFLLVPGSPGPKAVKRLCVCVCVVINRSTEEEDAGCGNGPARLLRRTANLADPTAKTGARAVKERRARMLAGGAGVAFHLDPSSGPLPPFAEAVVEITAYADVWGFYSDWLHCQVSSPIRHGNLQQLIVAR